MTREQQLDELDRMLDTWTIDRTAHDIAPHLTGHELVVFVQLLDATGRVGAAHGVARTWCEHEYAETGTEWRLERGPDGALDLVEV